MKPIDIRKMRKGITSITERLVFYNILVSFFAVALVGNLSYQNAKDALTYRTYEQLISVREFKKRQIENFFKDRKTEAAYLARTFNQYIDINKEKDALDFFVNNSAHYDFACFIPADKPDNFMLSNKSGIRAGSPLYIDTLSLLNAFSIARSNSLPTIKEYYDNKDLTIPELFIITPVYHNNKYYGAVILSISHTSINSIMFENNPNSGLGKSGESYLVGSDFLMRSNSRFKENSVFSTKVVTRGTTESLHDSAGTALYKDYRGIMVLGAYRKLEMKDLEWVVLAEIDNEEANIPIYGIRNTIIFLSIMISALVFISTYIISKRISNPVIKLTNAAKTIENGGAYEPIEITSKDEIGTLTYTFNKMAAKLAEHEEELSREKMKRARTAIDAQEKERERLAREFHDGLGQTLIALKLRLESIDYISDPERAEETIANLKIAFDVTIDEIRRISNDLMPAALKELGLSSAIKHICRDISGILGIPVELNIKAEIDGLEKTTSIYLFRIVQEGLNNAIKHSSASNIQVEFSSHANNINLIISDDGNGFNFENSKFGNGIYNIMDRAKLIGGSAHYQTAPGEGAVIFVSIPALQNG